MQCLGEARLEREADVVRRQEMIVEQGRAAERQKYAERGQQPSPNPHLNLIILA
jgi:hypothetical protein